MVIGSFAAKKRIEDRVKDKAVAKTAAMAPERSKRLHNFNLPTPELCWGNQKFLRCTKADSGAAAFDHGRSYAGSGIDDRSRVKRNRHLDFEFDADRGSMYGSLLAKEVDVKQKIEAIRENLMFDLKTAADSMKLSILDVDIEDDRFKEDETPAAALVPAAATEERPWNLRTRRAASKAAIANGTSGTKIDDKNTSVSPERIDYLTKPSRLRACSTEGGEKKEKVRLSVALSRKEIAEDYMAMIGGKPPRRPKKRSKTIQKQMDTLFPGLWLTEVTPEMYKVDEIPETVMVILSLRKTDDRN